MHLDLAHPVRRLRQNPRALLQPLITAGMTVLEPGPGSGFFTLELARLPGLQGRVVAIGMQPCMLLDSCTVDPVIYV